MCVVEHENPPATLWSALNLTCPVVGFSDHLISFRIILLSFRPQPSDNSKSFWKLSRRSVKWVIDSILGVPRFIRYLTEPPSSHPPYETHSFASTRLSLLLACPLLQHGSLCGLHQHENCQPWGRQETVPASRAHRKHKDRPVSLQISYRTFLWPQNNSAKGDFGASRTWCEHTIFFDPSTCRCWLPPTTRSCLLHHLFLENSHRGAHHWPKLRPHSFRIIHSAL